ncbi:sigma-70 family RNA polymerase sigma factor [Leptospira semungkisensis]|uniref:Sigma-70 family RNA polymerase sigma factor n=1 Tax=Leptospira semungkisensis TaxID=2484985 RepID=A0A4R9G6Y9_9LEPT|nr:sigma-70 family RNA polymerase sigma factor [Leptospira semungkisensis]TGK07294.1 sigma-70 family RNA polymerase sigma factor [Leptospira semungkisensis]
MERAVSIKDEFTDTILFALEGKPRAMEDLLEKIQDYIFNLSLRMLWDPHEAEDATQEILLKISNKLAGFRFESKFTTWVYSIASHHLLSLKRPKNIVYLGRMRDSLSLKASSERIEEQIEEKILEEEIRFGCVHAVLLKLNSVDRLVYVLSTVYGMASEEGAEIVGITAENFRQKLSRSKRKLSDFLSKECGLWIDQKTACPCIGISKHLLHQNKENGKFFMELKNLKRKNPSLEHTKVLEDLKKLDRLAWIYQSQGVYEAPSEILENLGSI